MQPLNSSVLDRWLVNRPFHSFVKASKEIAPQIFMDICVIGYKFVPPIVKKNLVTLGNYVFVLVLVSLFGSVVRFSLQVDSIHNYSW